MSRKKILFVAFFLHLTKKACYTNIGGVLQTMNRLKELRKEAKKTQQEAADIANVTKRTYIYWEQGERQIKPDKAQLLADYFYVDVAYLLGFSPFRNRQEEDFYYTTGYPISSGPTPRDEDNNEDNNEYNVVKITPHNSALSDEELMKLPKEERQKYIKEQFKNLEVQIASVNEKLSELSKISTESLVKLSSEQLNRLTTDLIQALAKVNEVNKNN